MKTASNPPPVQGPKAAQVVPAAAARAGSAWASLALGLVLLAGVSAWLWAAPPPTGAPELSAEALAVTARDAPRAPGSGPISVPEGIAPPAGQPEAAADGVVGDADPQLDPEGTKEVRRFPDGRVMTIRNDGVVIVQNHPMRIEHGDGRVELRRVTITAKPKLMTLGSAEQRAAQAAAMRREPDPSAPGRAPAPGRR